MRRLAAGSYHVFAADLDNTALHALAADHVTPIPLDVTDSRSVEAPTDQIIGETAALAGVVNFAGVLEIGSLIEIATVRYTASSTSTSSAPHASSARPSHSFSKALGEPDAILWVPRTVCRSK